MKNYFSFILLVLVFQLGNAQICVSSLETNPCPPEYRETNNEEYHILIQFHKNSSSVNFTPEDIDETLNHIADAFDDHGIYFYSDCKVYNDPMGPTGDFLKFIVSEPPGEVGFCNPLLCDRVRIPENLLLTSHTIHEMGRSLGLLHTQHPIDNSWPNDFLTQLNLPSDPALDCEVKGDCICDTNPDFGRPAESMDDLGDITTGLDSFSIDPITCLPSNVVYEIDANQDTVGFYDPDFTNVMSYHPDDCLVGFTPDQGRRMRNAIKYCSDLQDRLIPILQEGSFTWNQDRIIVGEVVLNSGDAATISGATINFLSPESRIIVNQGATLNIGSNTVLTSNCSTWEGIVVRGGNVNISGDQIEIRNARIGINASSNADLSIAGSVNSHIVFVDCHDFGVYGNDIELSDFSMVNVSNSGTGVYLEKVVKTGSDPELLNCRFTDLTNGVVIHNTSVVSVTGCFFDDITIDGLRAIDVALRVDDSNQYGSIFLECDEHGIRQLFTHNMMPQTTILNSTFTNNRKGILFSGNVNITNMVSDNTFTNNLIGMEYDKINSGISQFNTFQGNDFDQMLANTDLDILHNFNNHQPTKMGITTAGINDAYLFTQNCFEGNGIGDVYSFGNMSPSQGNAQVAASNCFNQNNTIDFRYLWAGDSLLYFVPNPNQNVDACLTPRDYALSPPAIGSEDANCLGSNNTPGQVNVLCTVPSGLTAIITELQTQNALINSLVANPCIDDVDPDVQMARVEACIRRLLNAAAEIYLSQQDYANLISLYQQQEYFDLRAKALSVYYLQSDYNGARNYMLNSIDPCTQEHNDFINVQHANIDKLEQGPNYTPTTAVLDMIEDVAEKNEPLAAYATGLFYELTGIWITSDYPDIPGIGVLPREKSAASSKSVRIFPNPANTSLTVELQGYELDGLKLEVYDLLGNLKFNQSQLEVQNQLDVSHFMDGVYLVKIAKEGQVIQTQKVMVTK